MSLPQGKSWPVYRGTGLKLDEPELQKWEEEQSQRAMKRAFAPKQHRKHPRVEALRDYRHHRPGGHWYEKEDKSIRKMTVRTFRRKLRSELWNEVYYHTRPRNYKTYGWLTW